MGRAGVAMTASAGTVPCGVMTPVTRPALHPQAGGRGAGPDFAAPGADRLRERLGESGETAPVVGEPFLAAPAAAAAPQLQLVPEPDRRHFLRQVAELPPEERFPHHPVHPFAAHLAQPVRGAPVLEAAPVPHPARPEREESEPEAASERQRREAQEVEGRREPEEVVGEVHAGPGGTDHDPVRLAELLDEPHHMHIAREPVVVELFEPGAAGGEAAGEPADLGVRFQHRGADAPPAEFVGGRQTAEPAADHGDPRAAAVGAGPGGHGPVVRDTGITAPEPAAGSRSAAGVGRSGRGRGSAPIPASMSS